MVEPQTDQALRDLSKSILDHLFVEEVKGRGSVLANIYDRLDQLDIELVITVPPGRSTVDHARVRQAFIYGPIKHTSIYVESEPAAMFRHWVHDGSVTRDWAINKSFVVADIGGGTCCIVRLRLNRLQPTLGFRQEYASSSIPFGAETIADEFWKLAVWKVPEDWPDREMELTKLTQRFESTRKLGFGEKPHMGMKVLRTSTRDQFWEFSL